MTTYYCVVQYLPRPESDEKINVGVIVFDDSEVQATRFLRNWSRAKSFATKDIAFVRAAVEELAQVEAAETIRTFSQTWNHSIQLTTPRASLSDAQTLLESVAGLMLVDTPPIERTHWRLQTARAARSEFERALTTLRGTGVVSNKSLRVETKVNVQGKVAEHEFDLSLQNGDILLAAQALSFAGPRFDVRKIRELAFSLQDTGLLAGAPDLAVIFSEPTDRQREDFVSASAIFRDLGTTMIPVAEANTYAKTFMSALAEEHRLLPA